MGAHVIFVEGCDTEPAKLPVYIVESEKHASHICEGIKETEYGLYRFSFVECTKSDLCKFPFWAKMTFDAQEGVYGNIIGGIYNSLESSTNDRTPLLHRVPFLGWLFKNDTARETQDELLIFITPKILK